MKQTFKSELVGVELFKRVILYVVAYIVCISSAVYMAGNENFAGYFLTLVLAVFSAMMMMYQIYSLLINSVSLNNEKFEFIGTFRKFFTLCVKGLLLSIITLGIYGAWFERNLISFFADNTQYPNKVITFRGKAGKLFKYMLLSFVLPVIALGVFLGLGFPNVFLGTDLGAKTLILFLAIYIIGVCVITAVYSFYVYKWYINFTFGESVLGLDVKSTNAILFLCTEIFLTVITLGIYGFVAYVHIFKYFVNNSRLTNETTGEVEKLNFLGRTGEGFKLLFIQTILSIITIGIYLPWAYANIYNWFISNVEIGE